MSDSLANSDYVVFVDESGDHSMTSIDPDYPMFVLSLCIFAKNEYSERLKTSICDLKFKTFGHDVVILHEHDIRKRSGLFTPLNKEVRDAFMSELTEIMQKIDFKVIAVAIKKDSHAKKYNQPAHPYYLAMQFALERLYHFMSKVNQSNKLTHVICEARGKAEDQALELEFRRICDGSNATRQRLPFEILIADKKTNCEGLQLADLTARPIGLSVLRPLQANRAMEIIETKFYRNGGGNKFGYGLKCFP